jgi:hypothetical protein
MRSVSDSLTIGAHILALTDNGARIAIAGSTDWPMWISRSKGTAWPEPPVVGQYQLVVLALWQCAFHKQLSSAVEYERRMRQEYAKPIQIEAKKEGSMPTTKEQSGVLFKNTDKVEGSGQPDYTGDLLLPGGVRWRLAGWIKEGAKGRFLSLSAKLDEPKSDAKPAPAAKKAMADGGIF